MSDNTEALIRQLMERRDPLPPLPDEVGFIDADGECHVPFYNGRTADIYTADQMRAYALAARGAQAEPPVNEREAFEAWAAAHQFCTYRDESDKYRDYHRTTTRWAWQAWQARAAQGQPEGGAA
jgi:hypothetical protein